MPQPWWARAQRSPNSAVAGAAWGSCASVARAGELCTRCRGCGADELCVGRCGRTQVMATVALVRLEAARPRISTRMRQAACCPGTQHPTRKLEEVDVASARAGEQRRRWHDSMECRVGQLHPSGRKRGGGGQPGHQRRRVRESWAVASRHDSDRRSSSNIKPNRPHGGGKG
jgi:hypothetical protein